MAVKKMTKLETVQVYVIHVELCVIIAGVMFAQTIWQRIIAKLLLLSSPQFMLIVIQ